MLIKNYALIEHTADIGMWLKAGNPEELFINSAEAMFDIMAERVSGRKRQRLEKFLVTETGDNIEELFINWLNELLSLSQVKEKIFCEFAFEQFGEKNLRAVVSGEDIANYRVEKEIKAATYHELEVRKINSSWQAKVIFDV